MARGVTPLTNTELKQDKPKDKIYKLADGYGFVTYAISNIGSQILEPSTTATKDSVLDA